MDYAFGIQVGGIIAALSGAFYVARWRVGQTEIKLTELGKDLSQLRQKFHDHEIMVAREYVSAKTFGDFRQEMKDGFSHVNDRLDKFIAARSSR